jgi:hypothetical protein
MMTGATIVPIFKTFDELQADETAIQEELVRSWNEANQNFDIAMERVAWLKKNPPGGDLSKAYTSTVAALKTFAELRPSTAPFCTSLVKAVGAIETKRLDVEARMAISRAETDALATLIAARKAAIDRRDEGMFGFGKLARRSQRFATAQLNKAYGPGAASLPKN